MLSGTPNLKALYRRGQAYIGMQRWSEAVTDMQGAASLATDDPKLVVLINKHIASAKRSAESLSA